MAAALVVLVRMIPPVHIEAFYRYQLNDNISITPGLIWLSAPQGNQNADDAFVGVLRTTFSF